MPTTAKLPPRRTRIQSVSRAAQILRVLGLRRTRMSAREIAAAIGLPSPTVHHLLNTLVDEGLVSREGRLGYQLGPVMAFLGDSYQQLNAPPEALMEGLHELADRTGESAYLVGWRNGEIVILAIVEGSHAVRVAELERGRSNLAHARASGKLLLAFAPEDVASAYLDDHPLTPVTKKTITDRAKLEAVLVTVRKNGFATDIEEFKEGVACVAAPIWTYDAVLHGYTISLPIERFRSNRKALPQAVKEVAATASLVTPFDETARGSPERAI